MNREYQILKKKLKTSLNIFRLRLLFYNLIRGIAYLILSLFLGLFLYYLTTFFFSVSVLIKTIYYYALIFLLSIGFLYFIIYPIYLFFKSSWLENDVLFKQILNYLPSKPDLFTSVYHLVFHESDFPGDEQLKKAAFVQKYKSLEKQGIFLKFPDKLLWRNVLLFLGVLIFFCFNWSHINQQYTDLKNFDHISGRTNQVQFFLQNEDLEVEYGKGLTLRLKVQTEDDDIDHVFICLGGGEFLMTREDSVFVYSFELLNNDLKFCFRALNQQSEFYKITVLPTPVITSYKVIYTPPVYTGLKPEIQNNAVDFRALFGSTLKFELNFADLDSLYLAEGTKFSVIPVKNNSTVSFTMNIRKSGDYALYGSNIYFKKNNLLNFNVTCIPDLYPGIQITEIQDSLRSSLHYFYGVITDDYGFTSLRFNYSVNQRTHTTVPIHINPHSPHQEFYFSFDFAEFAGMDKSEISYFFEIFDNDNISGPKSTRSDSKNYQVPDLNTIFDYNIETANSANSALNAAEELARDIVKGVKDMQRKMLEDHVDDWEKQQMAKDIVEKKNKLEKLLNTVKEENLKKSDLNKSFTNQDSILFSKQQQIQELLDKIMDDEMKDLLKEFSKLSEEFSKDKFKNLDEKMKLSFDQMSEKLDRNIELLKRFQIEEQHDLISKQLEKIKTDQEKLGKQAENKMVSKDSLSELSEELKEDLEKMKNNYRNLQEKNDELEEPFLLENFESDFNDLSRKVEEQHQNIGKDKNDKDLSRQIQQDIEKLSEKLSKQQNQNFVNKFLPKNQIELIIQNILIISLSQEELLAQFPKVESQSVKYNELGRLQDLKRQEYRIVKDSLSELAKSDLLLASLLSHKFYDIEIKFGLLPQYIQDNRRGDLAREQQFIITYLNDIALTLTDALQKSQREQGEKSGQGDQQKKGGGSEKSDDKEGYDRLKKYQNGLKDQLQDLISRMKKGDKGKPLQQGISNIIRQNELFRKSLNDFISGSGSLSNQEKQILNEINKLLDDNIKDIANYSVSDRLIERNNQIYNKLLISEKASREREEFEEKRKAESAKDFPYERPETLFNSTRKNSLIKNDLQKSDLKLKTYFKILYNNYYIKLGDE